MKMFSIHASAKEATLKDWENTLESLIFNPRLREGGEYVIFLNNLISIFFNPRLREGGDSFIGFFTVTIPFSIHASAKEATQHIVIPQLSCAYLVSTTFLSTIFSFISQYIVLFPLFRVRMPCVFCVAYDSHYVPLFNIFYILFQGTPF